MKREKPKKIDPNQVKVRDHLMVRLIQGATKGGAHKDRKKETSRKECRKKIRPEES